MNPGAAQISVNAGFFLLVVVLVPVLDSSRCFEDEDDFYPGGNFPSQTVINPKVTR